MYNVPALCGAFDIDSEMILEQSASSVIFFFFIFLTVVDEERKNDLLAIELALQDL